MMYSASYLEGNLETVEISRAFSWDIIQIEVAFI